MGSNEERIEVLRKDLEGLRERVHGYLDQPSSLTGAQVLGEVQVFKTRLIVEGMRQHPTVLDPFRRAVQEIAGWERADRAAEKGPFDRMAERVSDSLDEAQKMVRVTTALARVTASGEKAALDHLAQGEPSQAHSVIRRMIELLQGASREIRGLERGGPER